MFPFQCYDRKNAWTAPLKKAKEGILIGDGKGPDDIPSENEYSIVN